MKNIDYKMETSKFLLEFEFPPEVREFFESQDSELSNLASQVQIAVRALATRTERLILRVESLRKTHKKSLRKFRRTFQVQQERIRAMECSMITGGSPVLNAHDQIDPSLSHPELNDNDILNSTPVKAGSEVLPESQSIQ